MRKVTDLYRNFKKFKAKYFSNFLRLRFLPTKFKSLSQEVS